MKQNLDPDITPTQLIKKLDSLIDSSSESVHIKSMITIVENYIVVLAHRDIADVQRRAYNSQRKDKEALKMQILIEADYKQKIVIGLSPRQINLEYYNQEQRSCLG